MSTVLAIGKKKTPSIMNSKVFLWSSWKEFEWQQSFACSDAHSCSGKAQNLKHTRR